MAAKPDQDARESISNPSLPGEVERDRTDIRVVSLLGAIALLVAVGMWFYTKDREMIAGDGTTIKQTTGAGSQDADSQLMPRSRTPNLPAPSPPHQ